MNLDQPVSAHVLILVHLEANRHAGPTFAMTAQGTSENTGVSIAHVYRILQEMRKEDMVKAYSSMIKGAYPGSKYHAPPLVYEITEKGILALDEVRDLLRVMA